MFVSKPYATSYGYPNWDGAHRVGDRIAVATLSSLGRANGT